MAARKARPVTGTGAMVRAGGVRGKTTAAGPPPAPRRGEALFLLFSDPSGQVLQRQTQKFADTGPLGLGETLQSRSLPGADPDGDLPMGVVGRPIALKITIFQRQADNFARGLQCAFSTAGFDFGNQGQGEVEGQGRRD